MDWNALTDGARILCVILNIAILVLLQRSMHKRQSIWSKRLRGMFRFLNSVMIFLLIVSVTKVADNAPATLIPFGECLIFMYGIYAITRKGGYTNESQKTSEHERG